MTDIKILKEREEHINQMIYRVFSSQHKTDTSSADTDQIDESVNNILHIFLLIKFRQKDAQKYTSKSNMENGERKETKNESTQKRE